MVATFQPEGVRTQCFAIFHTLMSPKQFMGLRKCQKRPAYVVKLIIFIPLAKLNIYKGTMISLCIPVRISI